MSEASTSSLASLTWTEQLPTVPGHYFIACVGVFDGSLHQCIEMEDGVPFSFLDGWEKNYYKAGSGYLFFGPLVIPEPPSTNHSLDADNPIQGNDSDV